MQKHEATAYMHAAEHQHQLGTSVLQTKVNGEKDVDDIRTLMEEIDTRIKETKQETYEFKRDVILGQCCALRAQWA